MKVKRTEGTEKKSSPGRSNLSFQVITVLVIVAMALLFFFWHQKNFRAFSQNEEVFDNPLTEEISIPEQVVSKDVTQGAQDPVPVVTTSPTASLPSSLTPDDGAKDIFPGSPEVAMIKSETTASLPQMDPMDSVDTTSATCRESVKTIRDFYAHLDERNYLKQYNLGTSEAHFTALVQKLLNNPPVVSGETDDLYTILQNTAHFFRIIGKNNILALKAILDREKNQFENVLAQFYTLLHIPSCPEQNFNLEVSQSPLYDYAGFFLNTMGGRLYLFRRDSMSRMVVSYYAVMLIDQANKNAGNQHGIELKSAIDQLIDEIESTANTLQLKEIYLDRLYTLKEEYQ